MPVIRRDDRKIVRAADAGRRARRARAAGTEGIQTSGVALGTVGDARTSLTAQLVAP